MKTKLSIEIESEVCIEFKQILKKNGVKIGFQVEKLVKDFIKQQKNMKNT